MAITIIHKPNTCYFPQVLCMSCMHKQYIYEGGLSYCVACKLPFQLGIEAYALIYEESNKRVEFFNKK